MEKEEKDIGKIIEECINNPTIRYMVMREKEMTYEQSEKKREELARAIGYCMLFRSTEDVEQYMSIHKKDEQIEFLKEKIAKTLNIPKEEMQDKTYEMFEYAYKNFKQNGYVFHAANSASAEKKMSQGLDGTTSNEQHKKELMHIASIYKKYGNDNPLGWGTLDIKYNRNGWFFDGNPQNITYYADSPEWFNQFCGGNHAYAYGVVPQERRAGYVNRDYETALETVTALIDKNNMSNEDKNEVLNFFEKCWAKYADTKPCVLLVPLQEVQKILSPKEEFEFLSSDRIFGEKDPLKHILREVVKGEVSHYFNACSNNFVPPDKLSCVDLTSILPRFKIERNEEEKITLDDCIRMLKGFDLKSLKEAQQMLQAIEKDRTEEQI